ncbi:transcriptional regulator [Streptomyces longwoodensis]|uniref:Transcriptional regulator n=1 Tax=Streptomyces longwoodensis TaxID=68231 RepID=A0A101QTC4_9ACTN|nr:AfsR/SARP family transcriptional regulator [Streptomyces longwoodensis]KUN35643.1 transcriptional regulator [Streptomyces longwoodensis]
MANDRATAGLAGPRSAQAWRIAELEREVRELRRTNTLLRTYVAQRLDAGPHHDTGRPRTPAPPAHPQDTRRPAGERPPHRPAPHPHPAPAPAVVLRCLGPIEAVVGGRPVDLGSPKQRALLALLASAVGRPVACDVLVEELWAGSPPPAALSSLHAYVANLRRVLEPHRAPRTRPTVLRTAGRGYLLERRSVDVDVDRFTERAALAWQLQDSGDPHGALRAFDQALALWRGPAYAEAADSACVRPDGARLQELRLSATEGRCAALLAAGAHEIAVADLEAFVQDHPLREYGCELLGLALYRAGRQAEALAVLRTHQRRLARELGIDPRPALQRLQQQILHHAPSLDLRPPLAAQL